MSEKIQRLVMHAFRGVPGEMTVDFGNGESIVVYGDNGTGKSTIADALEWYFTGEIELLSHEGRQHAVRHVGGDDNGVTSVEVVDERHARREGRVPGRAAARSVPGHPPGDVPAPRAHAGGLHQQDQDGEMEGAGRDTRPRRHRKSARGPATSAKRAAQGIQGRGRTRSAVRAGPGLRGRSGHR